MPRASKTATRTRAAVSPSFDGDDAPHADQVDEPQPKPKKARTAGARVKGRRGAMSAFTNIPLDLLYDICANLEPRDLLALSTTSKVFRSVVTGAASAPLWVAARKRVGLPELAHPMTDLQYAHLLFGKGCSFCTRKNAGKPEVFYRARICTACMKDKFADTISDQGVRAFAEAFKDHKKMHPFTLLVANQTAVEPRRDVPHYRLEEVIRVSADLHSRFPESSFSSSLGHGSDSFFFIFTRTSGKRRSQAIHTEVTEKSTPFERWWFAEREDKFWAQQEDGFKLSEWIIKQKIAQAVTKEDLRKARREEIRRRFKDQGFQPDEFNLDFHRHSLFNKPELLTERTWTTVEAALKPILLASRSTCRRRFFQEQLATYQVQPVASLLAAYYPSSATVLSALPTWQAACNVDGFVELDELWASHKDAIVGELDVLVRSRIEGMLRAVGKAHADAVSAQERGEADELVPDAEPASVEVPALPALMPRSDDEPVTATDAQLVAFLADDPLSKFVNSCCTIVRDGSSALKHVASSTCAVFKRVEATEWAVCGGGGPGNLEIDGKILIRLLYLRRLLDSTQLVPQDAEIEKAIMTHKLDAIYPRVEDRMTKVPKCNCGLYSATTAKDLLPQIRLRSRA
ncbi:uncharacterized protein RHOBADRAFT_50657 [Rhodotorula graminis WP1]|uniref:F-box domain-containing protein n=1 Tax=Rhodotorula graminis (strain WP1) TaxID=578459 RepID=A0A194SCH9_RHOGW|nr:uncharacterized protein RHOBADRAFT_50657 [Rhodotorula graminis WP1]KPV78150.1 hypothetical protein RHOBADRAFT_50657 [Rhodotorula graminis WP1]